MLAIFKIFVGYILLFKPFGESQTFGDDAEIYALINLFLYHQIWVEKQMFLETKGPGNIFTKGR